MTKKTNRPQRFLNCLVDWDAKQITKDASGKMVIKGLANTPSKDRVGDVVLPSAFEKSLKEYMENPVVLFQHNWDKVIGKCIKADITDNGLYVECEVSNAKDVEEVKTKIAEGILKTFSIGYNEVDAEYDEKNACNVVKELELLEISVVTIPCNSNAKFVAEVETKEEEVSTEEKSFDHVGFFDYLADALKSLESTNDIDGQFLNEIYDIFKGGPGSGRKPGGGKPKESASQRRSQDAEKATAKADKASEKADKTLAKAKEKLDNATPSDKQRELKSSYDYANKVSGEHAAAYNEHQNNPSNSSAEKLNKATEKLNTAIEALTLQMDWSK